MGDDEDRKFAEAALGLPSPMTSGPTTPGWEEFFKMELQLPLPPGVVCRLGCTCGMVLDLDAVLLEHIGIAMPKGGVDGQYLSVTACTFCRSPITGAEFRPIP